MQAAAATDTSRAATALLCQSVRRSPMSEDPTELPPNTNDVGSGLLREAENAVRVTETHCVDQDKG